MDNKDLGSKKMNNKQSDADENTQIPDTKADKKLKPELEADTTGDKKVVDRARNANHDDAILKAPTNKNVSSKPSTASEELGKKMVENQDKNSDITPNRKEEPNPEDFNVD